MTRRPEVGTFHGFLALASDTTNEGVRTHFDAKPLVNDSEKTGAKAEA